LQIGAPGRGFAAEIHRSGSAFWCVHRAAIRTTNQLKSRNNVAPHFCETITLPQIKSMTYRT
jgi:hypothetical protein